jgi:hypothetical protein
MSNLKDAKIELAKALVREDREFLSTEERYMLSLLSQDPDVVRWMNNLKRQRNEMDKK